MSIVTYSEQFLLEQRYPKQQKTYKLSQETLEENPFYKQGWNDAIQTIIEGLPREFGDIILMEPLKKEQEEA